MRAIDRALALLCSDIHLSINPPAARRGESDWFAAMERTLQQVKDLASAHGNIPVICAGDVFDRWNSPPELINFALEHLPTLWAIPGQHDLPLHRMDLIEKSAFWTLVIAGKIHILDRVKIPIAGLEVYGFGWGAEIVPPLDDFSIIRLAVVHRFIWTGDYGYPGASDDSNLAQIRKKLKGYTAAVFGDNHKGFIVGSILNSGTLFRRKSDEIDYKPSVGILMKTGEIKRHFLDTSGEMMESVAEESSNPVVGDFGDFLEGLSSLSSDPLSFTDAMKLAMLRCSSGVKNVLEEVMV